VADDIETEVDPETGTLRLLCNEAQFERLLLLLRQEAEVPKVIVTVPATTIRAVSVELVTVDETPPGLGRQIATAGCAVAFIVIIVASVVGLWTMVQWVVQ
jgi:hypothetical protein